MLTLEGILMSSNIRPETMERITTFAQANAFIEEQIAEYDSKFATATEYNEADYATYNELKASYDRQMHEWEKLNYELELTEDM